jgi:hypothetical protein
MGMGEETEMNIWEKIFEDTLFEGGKVPSPEEKKKMYDKCFRRVKRMFKKRGLKPSKSDFSEELEDCLRDQLYRYQLQNEKARKNVGTAFSTETRNRQRENRELAEDVRRLNRINRDFWDSREDREESRKKENKKLKDWIESKVRRESGYEGD